MVEPEAVVATEAIEAREADRCRFMTVVSVRDDASLARVASSSSSSGGRCTSKGLGGSASSLIPRVAPLELLRGRVRAFELLPTTALVLPPLRLGSSCSVVHSEGIGRSDPVRLALLLALRRLDRKYRSVSSAAQRGREGEAVVDGTRTDGVGRGPCSKEDRWSRRGLRVRLRIKMELRCRNRRCLQVVQECVLLADPDARARTTAPRAGRCMRGCSLDQGCARHLPRPFERLMGHASWTS